MPRFHVLEVREGEASFREVEGEAVGIGMGVQAFFIRPPSGEWHCLYDVVSGARLTDLMDTDAEAVLAAMNTLEIHGVNTYKRRQEHFRILYGRPPEPEIEILQEPQEPGEITTCRMGTHCGHH